jgi:sigma-B regulation protein RsbU (phosphoserine phosphatase)
MFRSLREWMHSPLALRLTVLVLASTGLIFSTGAIYTMSVARELLLDETRENTRNLARHTVRRIDAVLQSVQPLPQLLAHRLAEEKLGRDELNSLLRATILSSSHMYGATAAFEAHKFAPAIAGFAPYYHRKEGKLAFVDLARDNYNYATEDWYRIPKELGQPQWSEPYYDAQGGKTWMCTYSVPFSRIENGKRVLAGIAAADVQLDHLVEIVSSIKLYQTGYAFLVSRSGRYLSYPDRDVVFRETIFTRAEKNHDTEHLRIAQRMINGEEGFARIASRHHGKMTWLYFAPVPSSGWSVGIQFTEDEILTDLQRLQRNVIVIGIVGFILLFAAVALVATRFTHPIRQLARQTVEIAKGNLDLKVPEIKSHDEIGDLTHSFENMRVALKEYIANLAHTTAAKERIESELKIARTIQRNFLPKRFPPFPQKHEFDLYADLQPAREVGGDLYDFFLLDDDHLFISIGDVAGKGVPAALFMAVSKTLIKGVAEQSLSPSQVLDKVNYELAQENDELMFVSVFCGVLELSTGKLNYTNAGHLPPLLLRPQQQPAWLDLPYGLLLGVDIEARYQTRTVTLQPGDTILLYTDGVTEAMNPRNELYSDKRLRDFVAKQTGIAPKPLVESIEQSVQQYSGLVTPPGASAVSMSTEPVLQSDDITLLALRYHGRNIDGT